MNSLSIARTYLQKHPEVYAWDCIFVGTDFTVETRYDNGKWEVQRLGGHAGLFDYLDQAIAAILDQEPTIRLSPVSVFETTPAKAPVAETPRTELETRSFVETTLSGPRVHELTFDAWMALVNRACVKISGLSTEDLGDFESWALWDSGTLPYEAARECLEQNDYPFED